MKVIKDPKTWKQINSWLLEGQSPELISGRIEKQEKDLLSVSKNSIRRYVKSPYGRRIESLRKTRKISHRGKKRAKLKDRRSIRERPISSEKRLRVEHSEADFVCSGKSGKGVIMHLADRKLRYHFLEKIVNTCLGNITRALRRIQKRYSELKTITTDNDLLFQRHKRLEKILNIQIFFCEQGKAWQKGQVEEGNMELRRHIPKGSDISKYSRYKIKKFESKLNQRFMKCLNYLSPKEAMKRYRKQKNSRQAEKIKCSD
jgi:IS30 family transposase